MMRRRILWQYHPTTRYAVAQLTTAPGYVVLDKRTGRQIGRHEPTLLAAIRRCLSLARAPPETSPPISPRRPAHPRPSRFAAPPTCRARAPAPSRRWPPPLRRSSRHPRGRPTPAAPAAAPTPSPPPCSPVEVASAPIVPSCRRSQSNARSVRAPAESASVRNDCLLDDGAQELEAHVLSHRARAGSGPSPCRPAATHPRPGRRFAGTPEPSPDPGSRSRSST